MHMTWNDPSQIDVASRSYSIFGFTATATEKIVLLYTNCAYIGSCQSGQLVEVLGVQNFDTSSPTACWNAEAMLAYAALLRARL